MLIPQAGLFQALRRQETITLSSPPPRAAGCSGLGLLSRAWLSSPPPCLVHEWPGPLSDAPMRSSLGRARVQLGCYLLRFRCLAFCSFKGRGQGRFLTPPRSEPLGTAIPLSVSVKLTPFYTCVSRIIQDLYSSFSCSFHERDAGFFNQWLEA